MLARKNVHTWTLDYQIWQVSGRMGVIYPSR